MLTSLTFAKDLGLCRIDCKVFQQIYLLFRDGETSLILVTSDPRGSHLNNKYIHYLGIEETVSYFGDVVRSQGLPSYLMAKYVRRNKIKKIIW